MFLFIGFKYFLFHQVSADGLYTFCGCGNRVNVLEVSTGKVSSVIGKVTVCPFHTNGVFHPD